MTATTVVHWDDRPMDEDWVYIGRKGGGLFGNPFVPVGLGPEQRKRCIEEFAAYFYARMQRDLHFAFEVGRLSGRVLVCHCKPLACHGDIIAGFLNSL